jgi:hypothetical protein
MATLPDIVVSATSLNRFSISEFKAGIGAVARPNLFFASFSGYEDIIGTKSEIKLTDVDIENFDFRCEVAELPGRSVATSEDTVGGGPALKLPYDITYNDINLQIICSEDMRERNFFEIWIDKIVGAPGRSNAGLLAYFQDYARGVILQVSQLDSSGKSLFTYQMNDIYPIALTPMTASWEEINTYQRFGVTLAYRYYTYKKHV